MDQAAGSERESQRIAIGDLQTRLDEVLQQALLGSSFLVTSADGVVAEIRPPPPAPTVTERQPGGMRGKIFMAPDFDTWPDGFLDAMEGKDG